MLEPAFLFDELDEAAQTAEPPQLGCGSEGRSECGLELEKVVLLELIPACETPFCEEVGG